MTPTEALNASSAPWSVFRPSVNRNRASGTSCGCWDVPARAKGPQVAEGFSRYSSAPQGLQEGLRRRQEIGSPSAECGCPSPPKRAAQTVPKTDRMRTVVAP